MSFIDPREGLLAASLTQAVLDMGPLAMGDGLLHHYSDGVWRPDGERMARRRVADLLGEQYRPAHASTVVDILTNRNPWLNSEEMDTQYLNLPNGLLDWRTGKMRPHDPQVRSAIRIPVKWNPDAECPAIVRWMEQVFPDDCREFVEEVIGYTLYNGNPLHKAIMAFGRGRNGKGTFLRLLTRLIGQENIASVGPQALDENRFMSAELYGKLANFAGDVDPRTFKATEMFKKVTGQDWVTSERKHGQPFQFVSRAVMIAAFNRLPRTTDTTEGFFSRWIIVPFTGYFPAGVADSNIEEKLSAEVEGLLVLAVRGLQRLMDRHAFELPVSVQRATGQFRQAADPIRAFLTERTEGTYDAWMPRGELFEGYGRWAEGNGYKPMGAATFYERVAEAAEDVFGYPLAPKVRRGTRGFGGISWRPQDQGENLSEGQTEQYEGAAGAQGAPHALFPPYVRGKEEDHAPPAPPCTPGVVCLTCRTPLNAALSASGITTHPSCEEAA